MRYYAVAFTTTAGRGLGLSFTEAEDVQEAFKSGMAELHVLAHQDIEEIMRLIPDHTHDSLMVNTIPYPYGQENAEAVHPASWHNLEDWSVSEERDCLSAESPDGSGAVVILPVPVQRSRRQRQVVAV